MFNCVHQQLSTFKIMLFATRYRQGSLCRHSFSPGRTFKTRFPSLPTSCDPFFPNNMFPFPSFPNGTRQAVGLPGNRLTLLLKFRGSSCEPTLCSFFSPPFFSSFFPPVQLIKVPSFPDFLVPISPPHGPNVRSNGWFETPGRNPIFSGVTQPKTLLGSLDLGS